MHYQAILFDMDGTLVPMDTDSFVKVYFGYLAKDLAPLGITPEVLVPTIWAGIGAMVRNDGSRSNADAFWAVFAEQTGMDAAPFIPVTEKFYSTGFHNARVATGPNLLAVEAVRLAREKAGKVVLATNPLFPMAGQETRMSWVGLNKDDFDLVTSYETDCFCKPNPAYYQSVCARMGVDPKACLMIGNDVGEDMLAAGSLGMETYLVTDCLIPAKNGEYTGPSGSFAELVEYLKTR